MAVKSHTMAGTLFVWQKHGVSPLFLRLGCSMNILSRLLSYTLTRSGWMSLANSRHSKRPPPPVDPTCLG